MSAEFDGILLATLKVQ